MRPASSGGAAGEPSRGSIEGPGRDFVQSLFNVGSDTVWCPVENTPLNGVVFTRWFGPYGLQAAIAACHAQASTAADTVWRRIVAFCDALAQATASSIVGLNRAVAVAMAFGPEAGLEAVEDLLGEPALPSYPLLPVAKRMRRSTPAIHCRNRSRQFPARTTSAYKPARSGGSVGGRAEDGRKIPPQL